MKHIFYCFFILFAAHSGCYAQSSPEVSDIFSYFKDKGLVKAYNISNINGYQEQFKVGFAIDKAIADQDTIFNDLDRLTQREILKGKQKFQTLDHIKQLFSDLKEKSAEVYNYECHTTTKDSIISMLTFKLDNYDKSKKIAEITSENGSMYFRYRAHHDDNQLKGVVDFSIKSNVDYSRSAKTSLNVDAVLKKMEPILKDKSIKKRTIIFRFDEEFDGYDNKAARKNGFDFFSLMSKKLDFGEYNTLVCKFTDEEKAMDALHKIMGCARNHVAEHPKEAFSMLSEDYFEKRGLRFIFHNNRFSKDDKKLFISTHMDESGFYICITYYLGFYWMGTNGNIERIDYKSVKEIINGKFTYYNVKI